jgi:hypothetical protein
MFTFIDEHAKLEKLKLAEENAEGSEKQNVQNECIAEKASVSATDENCSAITSDSDIKVETVA